MILSKRSFLYGLAILPLAIACNGESVTDTDPEDDTTPEGTSAPDYFEPEAFFVDGRFAYDPAANEGAGGVTQYTDALGNVSPSFLQVTLQDANGDQCVLQWATNSLLDIPGWVATASEGDDTVYAGFSLDEAAQFGTDCSDFEFDPDVYGTTDEFIARMQTITWGLGFSTISDTTELPVLSSLEDAVRGQEGGDEIWEDEWADYVLGGGFWFGSGDQGSFQNFGYSLGLSLDENFVVEYDDANANGEPDDDELAIQITRADVEDGTIPRGLYIVGAIFGPFTEGVLDL